MTEHRYDARAEIVGDEHELLINTKAQLMRLVLTDNGPLTNAFTGEQYTTADVYCHLTARQARQLADDLRALADQLTITKLPTPTTR